MMTLNEAKTELNRWNGGPPDVDRGLVCPICSGHYYYCSHSWLTIQKHLTGVVSELEMIEDRKVEVTEKCGRISAGILSTYSCSLAKDHGGLCSFDEPKDCILEEIALERAQKELKAWEAGPNDKMNCPICGEVFGASWASTKCGYGYLDVSQHLTSNCKKAENALLKAKQSMETTKPKRPLIDPKRPVVTEDGRPARILATDLKCADYPLVVATWFGTEEGCYSVTSEGCRYKGKPSDADNIKNTARTETVWCNVYPTDSGGLRLGYPHKTREEAEKSYTNRRPRAGQRERVGVKEIVLKEGEGL